MYWFVDFIDAINFMFSANCNLNYVPLWGQTKGRKGYDT